MRRLVLILALAACSDAVAPDPGFVMPGRATLDPPATYPEWYAEVEACVGQTGDYEAVNWFVSRSIWRGGQEFGGVLEFPDDITIAEAGIHVPRIVMHEMVHHVLQRGDEIHGTPILTDCIPSHFGKVLP